MTHISKKTLFARASGGGATAIPDTSANLVGGVNYPIDITGKTVYSVLVLDSAGQKVEVDWNITGTNLIIQSAMDVTGATVRIITK